MTVQISNTASDPRDSAVPVRTRGACVSACARAQTVRACTRMRSGRLVNTPLFFFAHVEALASPLRSHAKDVTSTTPRLTQLRISKTKKLRNGVLRCLGWTSNWQLPSRLVVKMPLRRNHRILFAWRHEEQLPPSYSTATCGGIKVCSDLFIRRPGSGDHLPHAFLLKPFWDRDITCAQRQLQTYTRLATPCPHLSELILLSSWSIFAATPCIRHAAKDHSLIPHLSRKPGNETTERQRDSVTERRERVRAHSAVTSIMSQTITVNSTLPPSPRPRSCKRYRAERYRANLLLEPATGNAHVPGRAQHLSPRRLPSWDQPSDALRE